MGTVKRDWRPVHRPPSERGSQVGRVHCASVLISTVSEVLISTLLGTHVGTRSPQRLAVVILASRMTASVIFNGTTTYYAGIIL
jgi:hypothetical protein